jgi:hypothetical protein
LLTRKYILIEGICLMNKWPITGNGIHGAICYDEYSRAERMMVGFGTPAMGLGTPALRLRTPAIGLGTPALGLGTQVSKLKRPTPNLKGGAST